MICNGDFDEISGLHGCDDPDCWLRGLTFSEINQLGFSLKAVEFHRDELRTKVFRYDGRLYALLTTEYDGGMVVVGVLMAPGLIDMLDGFTLRVRADNAPVN